MKFYKILKEYNLSETMWFRRMERWNNPAELESYPSNRRNVCQRKRGNEKIPLCACKTAE